MDARTEYKKAWRLVRVGYGEVVQCHEPYQCATPYDKAFWCLWERSHLFTRMGFINRYKLGFGYNHRPDYRLKTDFFKAINNG